MQPDQNTLLSRQRGTLPDKFWYQLNGKSAQENYMEQKAKMYERFAEDNEDGDDEIFMGISNNHNAATGDANSAATILLMYLYYFYHDIGKANVFIKCGESFGMVILKVFGEIKFHGVNPFLLSVYSIP